MEATTARTTVHLRPPKAGKQAEVLNSQQKRKIIRAGRRSGKTFIAATLALTYFLKGRRVLYAVPVSDQMNVFWREVKLALGDLIDSGRIKKNETEHFVEFPASDRRIKCKTAWNADTLRGDYADLLILDEWQLMNESAWEEVGAPMLLNNNGDAVFIYTPPSLRARATSVSKANDPMHAAKMYEMALKHPDRWLALHWTSLDNPTISREALEEVARDMSALSYRQEILAEDISEVPGALWKPEMIFRNRVSAAPELARIVIGLDPSGSSSNEAGIVAAGQGLDGHYYVLRDDSVLAATPLVWANRATGSYHVLSADRIVGERNYGGDMVKQTIRTSDPEAAYADVDATRGKAVRADPIVYLYEQGLVHHVGEFPNLEDEMLGWVPGVSRKSPNRMDALVWALTELSQMKLGIIDYYKHQAELSAEDRHALPASSVRVVQAPPPPSVEERMSQSRETFNRAMRR